MTILFRSSNVPMRTEVKKWLLICMGNLSADLIVGEHGTITSLAGTKMFKRVIHFLHRERLGSANA